MIAPLPQPPTRPRRRTALAAARQAVAEALLDREDQGDRRRPSISKRGRWIVIGAILAATVVYFVSISWWLFESH